MAENPPLADQMAKKSEFQFSWENNTENRDLVLCRGWQKYLTITILVIEICCVIPATRACVCPTDHLTCEQAQKFPKGSKYFG